MNTYLQKLLTVQQAVHAHRLEQAEARLLVSEINDRLLIDFYGFPHAAPDFDDLLNLLCEPEIANRVQFLRFGSPDRGFNGTRDWNFSIILESTVVFPQLEHLEIDIYDGYGHNHPIISGGIGADSYSEKGALAKWLDKAPNLHYLAAPSAPNSDFFKRSPTPLGQLHIHAGYDTQDFILNMSQATCFPNLWRLQYKDYDAPYIEDYTKDCTPLAHFKQLFQSPAFDSIRSFIWHNPIFSDDELRELKALRPNVGFKVVQTRSQWVK